MKNPHELITNSINPQEQEKKGIIERERGTEAETQNLLRKINKTLIILYIQHVSHIHNI